MADKILFKKQHDLVYSFSIERSADGPFKNLWTLKAQTPADAEPIVICDNDNLSTCIAKIGYIFEQDGL